MEKVLDVILHLEVIIEMQERKCWVVIVTGAHRRRYYLHEVEVIWHVWAFRSLELSLMRVSTHANDHSIIVLVKNLVKFLKVLAIPEDFQSTEVIVARIYMREKHEFFS